MQHCPATGALPTHFITVKSTEGAVRQPSVLFSFCFYSSNLHLAVASRCSDSGPAARTRAVRCAGMPPSSAENVRVIVPDLMPQATCRTRPPPRPVPLTGGPRQFSTYTPAFLTVPTRLMKIFAFVAALARFMKKIHARHSHLHGFFLIDCLYPKKQLLPPIICCLSVPVHRFSAPAPAASANT